MTRQTTKRADKGPGTTERERFNWGFWDARSDKANGRMQLWTRGTHFSGSYEAGYWAGRDDASGTDSSDGAWAAWS